MMRGLKCQLKFCGALLALVFMSAQNLHAVEITTPHLPRGKGERCVEPTEIMRKYHMDFLQHQRDLTVRSGIRTSRHSLIGCIDCHAQRDEHGRAIPVDAPGQFCQSCHAFTAVKLDCFECHANKPAGNDGQAMTMPPNHLNFCMK